MPFPKLNNSLSANQAWDSVLLIHNWSFSALVIASKKSKTVSETPAKLAQLGAVSETRGLAFGKRSNVVERGS